MNLKERVGVPQAGTAAGTPGSGDSPGEALAVQKSLVRTSALGGADTQFSVTGPLKCGVHSRALALRLHPTSPGSASLRVCGPLCVRRSVVLPWDGLRVGEGKCHTLCLIGEWGQLNDLAETGVETAESIPVSSHPLLSIPYTGQKVSRHQTWK